MRTTILSSGLLAAALIAAPQAAMAQSGGKPYCLQSPTGALNCTYDSFDECQQIQGGRSVGGGCIANPARSDTTGRGGMDTPRGLDAPRGSGPNSLDRLPPGGGGGRQQ
jgi:hypothetical protein